MLDNFPLVTSLTSSDIFPENPDVFFETSFEPLRFEDVDINTFGGVMLGDKLVTSTVYAERTCQILV